MKYIITVVGIISACFAQTAYAETTSPEYTVNLRANVDPICDLGTAVTAGTGFSDSTLTSTTFEVSTTGGRPNASSGNITFSSAICNTQSKITIEKDGLKNIDNLDPGSFENEIPYQLTVTWGSAQIPVNGVAQTVGPIIGALAMEITVDASEAKLAKGRYQDTIRLKIVQDI